MTSHLLRRIRHYIQSDIATDLEFDVGTGHNRKLMYGHKLYFQVGSTYFEKLFKNQFEQPIPFPDLDPSEFKKFQEYLYSNRITSVFQDLFQMYEVATKYEMNDLKSYCLKHIKASFIVVQGVGNQKTKINLRNVVVAFASRRPQLQKLSMDFLFKAPDYHVKEIVDPDFEDTEFRHMTGPLLKTILERKDAQIPEICLFHVLGRWVKLEFERRSYQQKNITQAEIAADYVKLIRLHHITEDEFFEFVLKSSMLTMEQISVLFPFVFPPEKLLIPYPPNFELTPAPVASTQSPSVPQISYGHPQPPGPTVNMKKRKHKKFYPDPGYDY